MTVDDCYMDQYNRSCIVFSGVKRFADVYDWLFNHYNGYKFGIVLDCRGDYPEPDNKIYVNFLDELMDEVALESDYIKKDNAYVKR